MGLGAAATEDAASGFRTVERHLVVPKGRALGWITRSTRRGDGVRVNRTICMIPQICMDNGQDLLGGIPRLEVIPDAN